MSLIYCREIIQVKAWITHCDLPTPPDTPSLINWLETTAKNNKLKYLLAHVFDGVIWGVMIDDVLQLSCDLNTQKFRSANPSPKLRLETVIQIRMFNDVEEFFIQRTPDDNLTCRRISEIAVASETETREEPVYKEALKEYYRLWGTIAQPINDVFTLFKDEPKGFTHVAPISVKAHTRHLDPMYPALTVQHYIKEDSSGFFHLNISRLVNLSMESIK